MAKQNTQQDTAGVDGLRAQLAAAQTAAQEAQNAVDVLIDEQTALPDASYKALARGDGAQFALLQERSARLPTELYFARTQALQADMAVVDAEKALLDAELAPLKEEFAVRMQRQQQAQIETNAVGGEIEQRQRRTRLLSDLRRRHAEKLAALQTEFQRDTDVQRAPIVRSLPHAVRPH